MNPYFHGTRPPFPPANPEYSSPNDMRLNPASIPPNSHFMRNPGMNPLHQRMMMQSGPPMMQQYPNMNFPQSFPPQNLGFFPIHGNMPPDHAPFMRMPAPRWPPAPNPPFTSNSMSQLHGPSQSSFSSQPTNSTTKSSSNLKSNDQIIVEQFLRKIGKLNKSKETIKLANHCNHQIVPQMNNQFLKISEAKELHQKAKHLVKQLEDLSKNSSTSTSTIITCKQELEGILMRLSNEEVIEDLQKKISMRKKKRMRRKQMRRRMFEEKDFQMKKIEEANKEICEWQKKEKIKLEQQRREEEMQKQLDEALLELRREQNAVSKCIDVINAIANLRKIRLNALKSKGAEVPSEFMTNQFEDVTETCKETLQGYKNSCASKVASLKLFLQTEQNEAKLAIERQKKKKLLEIHMKWEEERSHVLFGKADELNAFDPMWPVQELHKQATTSLHNLVQYRHLWDGFLHEKGTPLPVGWVEPVESSSDEWIKYRMKDKDS